MKTWLAQLALTTGHDKPLVAVSACLLGRPVRYDGDHKYEPVVTDVLTQHLTLREVCPEVGIGMPVPRPPIQVVEIGEHRRVRGVNAPHSDVTEALRQYGQNIAHDFCGFVLKARSPSCAVGTTPVFDIRDEQIGLADGEFSATLAKRFPCIPRLDETNLQTPQQVDNFLFRVHLYRYWREQPQLTRIYNWREKLRPFSQDLDSNTHDWLETLSAHSQ